MTLFGRMKKSSYRYLCSIFAAFICGVVVTNCCREVTAPTVMDHLDVEYLSGSIAADLMPIVPPDPIIAQVELLVENTHSSQSLRDIEISQADVYLVAGNERLGQIEFASTWDGCLEPAEQDTVHLTKTQKEASPFNPPCTETVYLSLKIEHKSGAQTTVNTDVLPFNCWY